MTLVLAFALIYLSVANAQNVTTNASNSMGNASTGANQTAGNASTGANQTAGNATDGGFLEQLKNALGGN